MPKYFFFAQMEKTLKTFSKFQKVLALTPEAVFNGDRCKTYKAPLNLREMKNYFDSDERLVQPHELRKSIFRGGVDPSLRKVCLYFNVEIYQKCHKMHLTNVSLVLIHIKKGIIISSNERCVFIMQ